MSISKVGTYAFSNHTRLQKVTIGAPLIEDNAFEGSKILATVDLTSNAGVYISTKAFSNCSSLNKLIIRSSVLSTLANTNAFNNTKIASGDGGIYVPANLLDSYKTATNWSQFAEHIYSIS